MRQIKFLFVFSLIILTSLFLSAHKSEIRAQDGNYWITKDAILKVGFIQGFISGTSLMNEKAIHQPLAFTDQEKKELKSGIKLRIELAFSKADQISLYGITIGQLTEGVDAFYSDFSTRKIKVIDAIYVVKMQIEGADPDLLTAQIRYLKQQPINAEEWKAIWDKYMDLLADFPKGLDEGKITAEELLKIGFFVDKDKKLITLFCYREY